jgi:hypothetical protein
MPPFGHLAHFRSAIWRFSPQTTSLFAKQPPMRCSYHLASRSERWHELPIAHSTRSERYFDPLKVGKKSLREELWTPQRSPEARGEAL